MSKPVLIRMLPCKPNRVPVCRHRPIFPGGLPPSIFGTSELNYRVRDGNGWTLTVISTDFCSVLFTQLSIKTAFFAALSVFGDP